MLWIYSPNIYGRMYTLWTHIRTRPWEVDVLGSWSAPCPKGRHPSTTALCVSSGILAPPSYSVFCKHHQIQARFTASPLFPSSFTPTQTHTGEESLAQCSNTLQSFATLTVSVLLRIKNKHTEFVKTPFSPHKMISYSSSQQASADDC